MMTTHDAAPAPVRAALARLDARIEREIARLRARYDLSLDEFRGLYVSDEQVDRLVAHASSDAGDAAEPRDESPERLSAGLAACDPRWARVVESFALSSLDEDLLLVAAAPELELRYETLYAYLNDDVTRKWPTADLARRLLARTDVIDDVIDDVVGALAPAATLTARRLVRTIAPPTGRPSTLNVGYALDPCVTYWLHGHAPARALDPIAVTRVAHAALASTRAAAARAAPIARLVTHYASRPGALPLVALVGRRGAGRTAIASAAARILGRPLLRVDLSALDDDDDVLARLGVALALEPSVVLVDGLDTEDDEVATNDEPHRGRARAASRVTRAVAAWPHASLVLLRVDAGGRWRASVASVGSRRVLDVACDDVPFAARAAVWRDAAAAASLDITESDVRTLAGTFALTPGQACDAVAAARDAAAMAGHDAPLTASHLASAAHAVSDRSLGRLATKVAGTHAWSDLVLPPPTLRRLREFAAAIRQRHVVYGEWGFGERLVGNTGISALFAGPSGTGKTMAAGVIARELGLELYRVDLAGLVSKYIGETEKNLDRIFRAAHAANAIVFLDEAEAVTGKRSEVKDAHDRYANIEVAYLLQRLEQHDGVVILATNLKRNIDDAFHRRLHYVVDFPRPEPPDRERIWRGMFPARAPLGGDVDFAFLARQFDLAGGDIRNVALDAAFLAAQDGGVIDMRVLVEALTRQLAKQGKTPTGTEFRRYQHLASARP